MDQSWNNSFYPETWPEWYLNVCLRQRGSLFATFMYILRVTISAVLCPHFTQNNHHARIATTNAKSVSKKFCVKTLRTPYTLSVYTMQLIFFISKLLLLSVLLLVKHNPHNSYANKSNVHYLLDPLVSKQHIFIFSITMVFTSFIPEWSLFFACVAKRRRERKDRKIWTVSLFPLIITLLHNKNHAE